MNKSERKYFHTAERMDEALLSLLLEKDFEYITVKDICARAGVNRSTFYLHYENTADLLTEAVAMIHERYQRAFPNLGLDSGTIAGRSKEDLFFMSDQWLLPWLDFVKENRRVYKALHAQADVFGVERAYRDHFQTVFSPVLSQYGVAEEMEADKRDNPRPGMEYDTARGLLGVRPSVAEYADYRGGRQHFPADVSSGGRFKRKHTPAHFCGVCGMVYTVHFIVPEKALKVWNIHDYTKIKENIEHRSFNARRRNLPCFSFCP